MTEAPLTYLLKPDTLAHVTDTLAGVATPAAAVLLTTYLAAARAHPGEAFVPSALLALPVRGADDFAQRHALACRWRATAEAAGDGCPPLLRELCLVFAAAAQRRVIPAT